MMWKGRLLRVAALLCVASVGSTARAQSLLWHYDDDCVDLDAMGDIDGDGVVDFIVDAQGTSDLKLLSGADGSVLQSFAIGAGALYGYSVAAVGDWNGDGFVDFAAGDPNFQNSNGTAVGEVTLVSGNAGTTLYQYVGWDNGIGTFERSAGTCVAAVGDVDADGNPDFSYGIWCEPVYLNIGPSRVTTVKYHSGASSLNLSNFDFFDRSFDSHSHSLTGMGDVNGNGRDDFAVGSVDPATQTGVVEVRGGLSGVVIWTLSGTYSGEHFGMALRSCADLDGDGVRELLIGSPGSNEHGTDAGRVDVVSGRTGALLLQVFGEMADQRFGVDVDGLGDLDGDGIADFVVASLGTVGGVNGRIEVFAGGDGRQLARIVEAAFRVRGAGDLDGDGRDDVVATSRKASIHALSIDLAPTLTSVTPSRDRYDRIGKLALHGARFTSDPNLAVTVDGVAATNVSVSSFNDLTCTAPPLEPGPHDVAVTTKFGTATLAGGLVATPAAFVDGDAALGATIDLRLEFDRLDSSFVIVGFAPAVSIPTPPFHGALGILPFVRIATLIAWPTDEYVLPVTVPNDPSLVGMTGLLQSLTGSKLGGAHKDGAWTNLATIAIH